MSCDPCTADRRDVFRTLQTGSPEEKSRAWAEWLQLTRGLTAKAIYRARKLFSARPDIEDDDIVQEAACRFLKALPGIDPSGNPASYWCSVIFTAGIGLFEVDGLHLKREEKTDFSRRTFPQEWLACDGGQSGIEDPEQVRTLMEYLEPHQQQAVADHYLKGMTFPEISEAHGISYQAARMKVEHAIQAIRRCVKEAAPGKAPPHFGAAPRPAPPHARHSELLRQVSLQQVMELLGYDLGGRQLDVFSGRCPLTCDRDVRRVCRFDLAANRWRCRRCRASGDQLDLYAIRRATTLTRAAAELKGMFATSAAVRPADERPGVSPQPAVGP